MTVENTPDTIVLIHGLWVTPRSWEHWIDRYEGRGYRVLAPAYPGLEGEVEALREDPSPIAALTVPAVVEHYEGIIGELESPPIIMGHSMGGLLTQILLDHGYGAAGVAIDSAPPEGVRRVPLAQTRAAFPVLRNPANRHRAVGFTPEQFHYGFANTLSREESDEVYERYHIPAPGSFIWGAVLANFTPGHQEGYVNFNNDDRAPLLLIAGGEDHLQSAAVNESNFKHYRNSKAITDYKEFPGRALHRWAGWLGGGRRLRARVGHGERESPGSLSTHLARLYPPVEPSPNALFHQALSAPLVAGRAKILDIDFRSGRYLSERSTLISSRRSTLGQTQC